MDSKKHPTLEQCQKLLYLSNEVFPFTFNTSQNLRNFWVNTKQTQITA